MEMTLEAQLQRTVIETRSPILAWYLTKCRGLQIRSVRCTPYLIPLLGTMMYARSWILVAS